MGPIEDGTGRQYFLPSTMSTRAAIIERPVGVIPGAPGQPGDTPPGPGDTKPAPGGTPKPKTDTKPANGETEGEDQDKPIPNTQPQPGASVPNVPMPVINGIPTVRARVAMAVSAVAPMLDAVLTRSLRIENDRRAQACKNGKAKPAEWAEAFYPDHELQLRGELMPVAEALLKIVGAITADHTTPLPGVNELTRRASGSICAAARHQVTVDGTRKPVESDAAMAALVWNHALGGPPEGA
jgi:hypothetical protein